MDAIKVRDTEKGEGRRDEAEGSCEGEIEREGVRRRKEEEICKGVEESESMVAIIHAGADLLLRTAYCPDKFSHRVAILRLESS